MCVWLFWGKNLLLLLGVPWLAALNQSNFRVNTLGHIHFWLSSAESFVKCWASTTFTAFTGFTESHWVPARIHSYAQGHLEDYVSPNEWLSHVIFISVSCKARHSDNHGKKAPTLYRLLHMQSKREFLVSPGFHGLKLLIITNSVLIYINIFTLDYCD